MTRTYRLPWPPSTNYAVSRGGRYLDAKTVAFREAVYAEVLSCRDKYSGPMAGAIACDVQAYPPNLIRRDLDNLLKATLDALKVAGAFGDDSQVVQLSIRRREVRPDGELLVKLKEVAE